MRRHLQEGLTVETTTVIIIVAHEMALVEDEKYTLAAKVTHIQVAMNVVGEKTYFPLLIRNTLSIGADKKEGIHLWIGCIVHLVKHRIIVQDLGDPMEVTEKADMKVEAGTKVLSCVPNIISKKKNNMLFLCSLNV